MRYEIFKDNVKLSKLGLGAMRLPQTEPGFAGPIDEPKAQEVINYCMAHGVNYYDTAYIYHGSVKNFVALVKNGSFLVRITDMTILIEKEFIYGSSKRPNPTDYYRKQHYQCG